MTTQKKKVKSKLKVYINPAEAVLKESKQGHMADALALGGDEGRDKLRKAAVRCK